MEIQKVNVMGHLEAAVKLGEIMAKSGMFGIKSPEQGVILAMTCAQENITPIEFMRKYHIIEGKPTMRADAMLAEFCRAGGSHKITAYTNTKVEIIFTWKDQETTWEWTIEDAKQAGLAGRDNWRKYTKAMLFSRCVSEALKRICPELFHGLYVPEEIQDIEPEYKVKPAGRKDTAPITPPTAKKDPGASSNPTSSAPSSSNYLIRPWTASDGTHYDVGTAFVEIPTNHLIELKKIAFAVGKTNTYDEICDAIEARKAERQQEEEASLDIEGLMSKFRHAKKPESKTRWAEAVINAAKPTKETAGHLFNMLAEIDEYAVSQGALVALKEECEDLMTVIVTDTKGE